VLYDPLAELTFNAEQLAREGPRPYPRRVHWTGAGVHDPGLLRVALDELLPT
jgi:hypothetical protein